MYDAKIFVSILSGVIGGFFAYLISVFVYPPFAVEIALIFACLVAILIFPAFVIAEKITKKRYAEVEKGIKSPVVYKTNGNFILDNQVKNGNIYFCETGILMISLHKKTWLVDEVLMQNIANISFDNLYMTLRAKDGRVFRIMMPDTAAVETALKSKKWFL
ncbi:MAG: hypothetical protein GX303_06275 [Clostridiales bacterium]|nr:hypothetical protein [Clostridiales bacterium]